MVTEYDKKYGWLQRGVIAYNANERCPLKVCCEPMLCNGQYVCVCTVMTKAKAARHQGMWAIDSLLKTDPHKKR